MNFTGKTDKEQATNVVQSEIKEAHEATRKKDYFERNLKFKRIAKIYTAVYPKISIFSGAVVGIFGGHYMSVDEPLTSFNWWFNVLFLSLFCGFIAMIAEFLKESKNSAWLSLGLAFSIVLSVGGGFLANNFTNSKTDSINTEFKFLQDSVIQNFDEQIAVYDGIIAINNKRLITDKSNRHTPYHVQKDNAEAQSKKQELIVMRENKLSELKASQNDELLLSDKALKYKGYVYTLVFFILEIGLIYAYFFIRSWHKNVRLYNEKYKLLDITDENPVELLLIDSNNKVIASGTSGSWKVETENQIIPESDGNKVGFQFRGNVSPSTQNKKYQSDKPQRDKYRSCECCGTEFEFKHWNAKYCSGSCRKTAWEKRQSKK